MELVERSKVTRQCTQSARVRSAGSPKATPLRNGSSSTRCSASPRSSPEHPYRRTCALAICNRTEHLVSALRRESADVRGKYFLCPLIGLSESHAEDLSLSRIAVPCRPPNRAVSGDLSRTSNHFVLRKGRTAATQSVIAEPAPGQIRDPKTATPGRVDTPAFGG